MSATKSKCRIDNIHFPIQIGLRMTTFIQINVGTYLIQIIKQSFIQKV